MDRIKLIRNQISFNFLSKKNIKIVDSAYDYLNFDQFLNNDERTYRLRLRVFLDKEIKTQMYEYLEKREFPWELLRKFVKEFPGILGLTLKGYGSANLSAWLSFVVALELARCDISFSTFCMIHGGELIMKALYYLGSEEQKEKYLHKMNTLDITASFCLTEADYGSDASNLKTSIKEDPTTGNYILNGEKRWIGNATEGQFLLVWARNDKTKQIEGYIVPNESKGVTINKITTKWSTRGINNSDIKFDNVIVDKLNKLPKAKNFGSDVNQMLLGSRLIVAWGATGACIGAYDTVIKYCSERKQFNRPLTGFQLSQEKLSRMMGNIQAMLFFCKRSSELYLQGELTMGKAGLVKAWCTKMARETVLIARELMGGNGILLENHVMKTLMDIESVYTYEGSYDINMLVCGKELTGISAFV